MVTIEGSALASIICALDASGATGIAWLGTMGFALG